MSSNHIFNLLAINLGEALFIALKRALDAVINIVFGTAANLEIWDVFNAIGSFTGWILAIAVAIISWRQFVASKKALELNEAVLQQNEKAMKSAVEARRPWLNPSIELAGDVGIHDGKKWIIPINVEITNHGLDPAIYVDLLVEAENGYSQRDIRIALNKDDRRREVASFQSDTIFPNSSASKIKKHFVYLDIPTEEEFKKSPMGFGKTYKKRNSSSKIFVLLLDVRSTRNQRKIRDVLHLSDLLERQESRHA